ncbi:MAG TPA: 50S ribosome-binding GTPase [Planctomycetota bacterium]|nr:50S ribosome-binding GTPase [Planctomycetota bacterium]HRR81521.1 50S ribosome-binding GTPase [Planctomycetota bacterium]HRT92973.1 50S ribosome-binding GTPase [Planctomycetota bacterium]
MSAPRPTPTVAAILTPLGQGGIAILHVAGPRAFELAAALFRPKSGGAAAPDARRLFYGHVVDDGEVVDEVLVRLVPGAAAGEDRVEVNCHGGLVAVQRVLECFTRRGARAVEPQALVRRTARGPLEAEAAEALEQAATPLGVEVLLDQLGGALERAVRALPWERPADAAAALRALLATERLGRALWQPLGVALVGPVNAGKSSLFNALAREDRMIVSPTPGTTRDAVSALVAVGGLPVRLTDTAGEREPACAIEREAIARARAAAAEADLAVLVLDGSAAQEPPRPLVDAAGLVALNKCDLGLAPWTRALPDALAVSAMRGDGLDALAGRIVGTLVGEAAHEPGRAVVFTGRQGRLLGEALARAEAGEMDAARRAAERVCSRG